LKSDISKTPTVGELKQNPLPEIFRRIYREGSSGVLDLQCAEDQRRVYFVAGEVRSAVSNSLGQKIGQHLKNAGLIVDGNIVEALEKRSEGFRLGGALVDLGAIDKETLEREMRKLIADIIYSAFAWGEGYFRFTPSQDPVPADVMLSVSTADVIMGGIRKISSDDVVFEGIGNRGHALRLTADPFLRLQHITLTPEEGYLLSRLDGATSTDQLLKLSPIEQAKTVRLVYGLIATGILEEPPKETEDGAGSPAPDAPKAAGGSVSKGLNVDISATRRTTTVLAPKIPVSPSFMKDEVDFRRRKILKTHQRLRRMTAHDLLELAPNPTYREIRQKYNDLAEIYHPDLAFKPEYADMKVQLVDIFKRLEEAYRAASAKYGSGVGQDL